MNIGKNYLLTKRIDLGLEFGGEKPDDLYIVFSELETGELMGLKNGDEKTTDALLDVLAKHVVEHNGADEHGNAISHAEILKIIKKKSIAAMKVVKEYSAWVADPFPNKTEPK